MRDAYHHKESNVPLQKQGKAPKESITGNVKKERSRPGLDKRFLCERVTKNKLLEQDSQEIHAGSQIPTDFFFQNNRFSPHPLAYRSSSDKEWIYSVAME